MLQSFFHAWERQLVSVTKDRVVRPFEWGLDWIPKNGHPPSTAPHDMLAGWVSGVMSDTEQFFASGATSAYTLAAPGPEGDRLLSFPSALETPHSNNNTVYARFFESKPVKGAESRGRRRTPTVECGSGRARRSVPAPRHEWDERAEADDAVSRSADAAGAPSCGLHRQRQRRADRAGVRCRLDARRAIAWLAAYDRMAFRRASDRACRS
jgi:hypothetical protein